MNKELPITAYEFHNYTTGHCYVDYVPRPDMEAGYIKIPLVTVERLNIEVEKAKNVVYEFRYNPDCHESGSVTISIHETRKGAEMAMEFHKAEIKRIWDEEIKLYKEINPKYVPLFQWDFNQHWSVRETKLLS